MLIDIKRGGGSNPGGNCMLQYVPWYDLLLFATVADGLVTSDLVFRAGKRMLLIETVENKLSYDEEPVKDANGSPCNVSIKGFIRGDYAALRPLLAEMMTVEQHIVKCRDNAGITRLVGNDHQQLRFRYKFSTGENMSAFRSCSFEFYGQFLKPPPVTA